MKIAVCDDERACREDVLENIKLFGKIDLDIEICEFCSGEDLLKDYKAGKKYDVIFLDVEMDKTSGVEAGIQIRAMDSNVIFVFITGFAEYIPDAFRLNAFQFLIKPINREVFKEEFKRVIETHKKRVLRYKISFKGYEVLLEAKDIIYIETSNRKVKAVTRKGEYEYLSNMVTEERKFSDYHFVRCHQSFLLNMQYIRNIEKDQIVLINNLIVPISKRLRAEVVEKFNKYISGVCI